MNSRSSQDEASSGGNITTDKDKPTPGLGLTVGNMISTVGNQASLPTNRVPSSFSAQQLTVATPVGLPSHHRHSKPKLSRRRGKKVSRPSATRDVSRSPSTTSTASLNSVERFSCDADNSGSSRDVSDQENEDHDGNTTVHLAQPKREYPHRVEEDFNIPFQSLRATYLNKENEAVGDEGEDEVLDSEDDRRLLQARFQIPRGSAVGSASLPNIHQPVFAQKQGGNRSYTFEEEKISTKTKYYSGASKLQSACGRSTQGFKIRPISLKSQGTTIIRGQSSLEPSPILPGESDISSYFMDAVPISAPSTISHFPSSSPSKLSRSTSIPNQPTDLSASKSKGDIFAVGQHGIYQQIYHDYGTFKTSLSSRTNNGKSNTYPQHPITPEQSPVRHSTKNKVSSEKEMANGGSNTIQTRFLLVWGLKKDISKDSVKRFFLTLGDIRAILIKFLSSHGAVIVAFFDIRKAAAAEEALHSEDHVSELGSCEIKTSPVSVPQIVLLLGDIPLGKDFIGNGEAILKVSLLGNVNGTLNLSSLRTTLEAFGELKGMTSAERSGQSFVVEFFDSRSAAKAKHALNDRRVDNLTLQLVYISDPSYNSTPKASSRSFIQTRESATQSLFSESFGENAQKIAISIADYSQSPTTTIQSQNPDSTPPTVAIRRGSTGSVWDINSATSPWLSGHSTSQMMEENGGEELLADDANDEDTSVYSFHLANYLAGGRRVSYADNYQYEQPTPLLSPESSPYSSWCKNEQLSFGSQRDSTKEVPESSASVIEFLAKASSSDGGLQRRMSEDVIFEKRGGFHSISGCASDGEGCGSIPSHPVRNNFLLDMRDGQIPEANRVKLDRIEKRLDSRTTVMIKDIPNKLSRSQLVDILNSVVPRGFDFVYLRMDFRNKCNVGYAFVNFTSVENLRQFAAEKNGVRWNIFASEKTLTISYANVQSQAALIDKFRNSAVMLQPNTSYHPLILHDGIAIPFPPPDNNFVRERAMSSQMVNMLNLTQRNTSTPNLQHHLNSLPPTFLSPPISNYPTTNYGGF